MTKAGKFPGKSNQTSLKIKHHCRLTGKARTLIGLNISFAVEFFRHRFHVGLFNNAAKEITEKKILS